MKSFLRETLSSDKERVSLIPVPKKLTNLYYYAKHTPFAVRNTIPALPDLFGAKACFFTAAGSPNGDRTLPPAKKNTPYYPKISPQLLLSLTMSGSCFLYKVVFL